MGKNAMRKPRPSIPNYEWLNRDGCWFCENKRNCNSCKCNKRLIGEINKRKNKKLRKVDLNKENLE